MEEKSVYDHGKENGGVVHLVDVPSMEQMESDEAVAAATAASPSTAGCTS